MAYIDDWQALYLDGELKLQGQNLEIEEIFAAIGMECTDNEVDSDWMDEVDFQYPNKLEEVKFI